MNRQEFEALSLDNVGGIGVARELFQHELDRVIANLVDVNADPLAKRSVSFDVQFQPGDDGEVRVFLQASSKIAPFRGVAGVVFVGRRDGKPAASVINMKQLPLGFDAPAAIAPALAASLPDGAAASVKKVAAQ